MLQQAIRTRTHRWTEKPPCVSMAWAGSPALAHQKPKPPRRGSGIYSYRQLSTFAQNRSGSKFGLVSLSSLVIVALSWILVQAKILAIISKCFLVILVPFFGATPEGVAGLLDFSCGYFFSVFLIAGHSHDELARRVGCLFLLLSIELKCDFP